MVSTGALRLLRYFSHNGSFRVGPPSRSTSPATIVSRRAAVTFGARNAVSRIFERVGAGGENCPGVVVECFRVMGMSKTTHFVRGAALAAVAGIALTGCTSVVAGIEVAPDATNPECAQAMVAMPEEIAGHERRRTDSQSTAAWGDPAVAVFRCGVEVPGPTTDECVGANGVDWVVREEGSNWRITTYGRDPAMEVLFDGERVSSSSVMVDVGNAAARIEADGGCTDPADAQVVPGVDDLEDRIPEGVAPQESDQR